MNESGFFNKSKLGPLVLRNKSIRAAAFEGMSQNHNVTDELIAYHTAVAKGGIGLTTVAYASVSQSGLSFKHQLLLRDHIIPGLKKISDSVHKQGAAISIQIGHCGNMADRKITGARPLAPNGGINWYGPTFPRRMHKSDIMNVISDFRKVIGIVDKAGFDAIEVHAGHGYLISQFLSPYTNKRRDEYGGDFSNRSRFMRDVLIAIRDTLPKRMAFLVKMNTYDGFSGGITKEEGILTAKIIEECGADAIVVSGGFVSKAPMFILRGSMPTDIMAYFMNDPVKRFFVKVFGKQLIPDLAFEEGYFMEDARQIKQAVNIPIVLVGGMNSMEIIDKAMNEGFDFIAIARALIENPNFINDLKKNFINRSECTICNYCIAKMYSDKMSCHYNEQDISSDLMRKIEKLPKKEIFN